ncbi:hypothetical protein ACLK19_26965 [Escherichia coli]
MEALLRGWGYNVALANSGRQALEQVREEVFDWRFAMCEWRRWTASPRKEIKASTRHSGADYDCVLSVLRR